MPAPSIFNILFGLAAGLTAWVSAILVSRRFATERAALVVDGVSTDARGQASVTLANLGSRPALAIHLLVNGRQVAYADGLAAGSSLTLSIGRWEGRAAFRVVFVDASRHRRAIVRLLEGGEAPGLVAPDLPCRFERVLQWLHLREMS